MWMGFLDQLLGKFRMDDYAGSEIEDPLIQRKLHRLGLPQRRQPACEEILRHSSTNGAIVVLHFLEVFFRSVLNFEKGLSEEVMQHKVVHYHYSRTLEECPI